MALIEFVNDSAPYLSAENLNNNFEYLDDKIQSNIVIENISITNISINSGATIYKSFTIPSKTGYTPIAISVSSLSGTYSGYIISTPALNGDMPIYNGGSGTANISIGLKIVYLKN